MNGTGGGSSMPATHAVPDRTLEDLIDHFRNRFYGLYRGVVTDNNDSNNLGRIKA